MAIQYGVNYRNAGLNGKATNLGGTASLKIFSGAVPANCAAADPTGLLCTITLPASPFASASGGAMNMAGSWTANASGTGTAQSHRVYDSSANCAIQGNVTTDLVLNNTAITSGQSVTVTQYTLTSGNS
jgi:hypothetical protein